MARLQEVRRAVSEERSAKLRLDQGAVLDAFMERMAKELAALKASQLAVFEESAKADEVERQASSARISELRGRMQERRSVVSAANEEFTDPLRADEKVAAQSKEDGFRVRSTLLSVSGQH